MVKALKSITPAKKSLGHKIRKYVRALPVHYDTHSASQPNVRHLQYGSTRSTKQTARTKWYPADDVKAHPARKGFVKNPTKLRKGIAPGQVLILLAGRFRGRRVVFLKQLPSGLLLVTGPFKINGVPLKRVNQNMVIPTSTKVDVSGVKSAIGDQLFNKVKESKKVKRNAKGFFEVKTELKPAQKEQDEKNRAAKKTLQKEVDAAVQAAVGKESGLKQYLSARFSLSNNDKPHLMRF